MQERKRKSFKFQVASCKYRLRREEKKSYAAEPENDLRNMRYEIGNRKALAFRVMSLVSAVCPINPADPVYPLCAATMARQSRELPVVRNQ